MKKKCALEEIKSRFATELAGQAHATYGAMSCNIIPDHLVNLNNCITYRSLGRNGMKCSKKCEEWLKLFVIVCLVGWLLVCSFHIVSFQLVG